MSSFVVGNKTIKRIVLMLEHDAYRGLRYLNHHVAEIGYDMTTCETSYRLAADMRAMNLKSVHDRYGDKARQLYDESENSEEIGRVIMEEPLEILDCERESIERGQNMSVTNAKALECFLYQCEGEVTGTPLYKALREIHYHVLAWIVSQTAEYGAAPWD